MQTLRISELKDLPLFYDEPRDGAAHNLTFLSTLAVAKSKASPSPVEQHDKARVIHRKDKIINFQARIFTNWNGPRCPRNACNIPCTDGLLSIMNLKSNYSVHIWTSKIDPTIYIVEGRTKQVVFSLRRVIQGRQL